MVSSMLCAMQSHVITHLFLLVSFSSYTEEQQVWYVVPDYSPTRTCSAPSNCLTLGQYAQTPTEYFTSGSTFVFLPGNHSTSTPITLTNSSGITFQGEDESLILCQHSVTVLCQSVSNLTIREMTFILSPSNNFYEPSALKIFHSKDVWIYNSTFRGSGIADSLFSSAARAMHIEYSSVSAISCLFLGNTGLDGGAVYIRFGSKVLLSGNVFLQNRASLQGGALYVRDSDVTITGIDDDGYAERERNVNYVMPQDILSSSGAAYFLNNTGRVGGAISTQNSSINLDGGLVVFQDNSATDGGAINCGYSNITASSHCLIFQENRARSMGGAILAASSTLHLDSSDKNTSIHVIRNHASIGGGIYFKFYKGIAGLVTTALRITSNAYFIANNASEDGGALYMYHGNLTFLSSSVLFSGNIAVRQGGAIYIVLATARVELQPRMLDQRIEFRANVAESGGGLYITESSLVTDVDALLFVSNVAWGRGGGLHYNAGTYGRYNLMALSARFINNTATNCGGGAYIESGQNVTFERSSATGNSGSAFCVLGSRIQFSGQTNITRNMGRLGGGIRIIEQGSSLSFSAETLFDSNRAFLGGAIYTSQESSLMIDGNSIFIRNRADADGGALYVQGTRVTFQYNYNHRWSTLCSGHQWVESG